MEKAHYVLFRKEQIDNVLAVPMEKGKNPLEPLKSLGLPFNIIGINAAPIKDSGAEVHKKMDDLFLCMSGKIDFVCGGELVNPTAKKKLDGSQDEDELRSKEIKGGTELVLNPGDWLWVPAGTPHKNGAVAAHLIVIKIPSEG